jgi:hypothetical protein
VRPNRASCNQNGPRSNSPISKPGLERPATRRSHSPPWSCMERVIMSCCHSTSRSFRRCTPRRPRAPWQNPHSRPSARLLVCPRVIAHLHRPTGPVRSAQWLAAQLGLPSSRVAYCPGPARCHAAHKRRRDSQGSELRDHEGPLDSWTRQPRRAWRRFDDRGLRSGIEVGSTWVTGHHLALFAEKARRIIDATVAMRLHSGVHARLPALRAGTRRRATSAIHAAKTE